MTTKSFTGKGGETWEWEETPEVVASLAQLHNQMKDTERQIANSNLKRPHERPTNHSGRL
jgi:hypothetical protein